MKLVSYVSNPQQRAGLYINEQVYDLRSCDPRLPGNMKEFLEGGPELMRLAIEMNRQILGGERKLEPQRSVELIAPVPNSPSLRDAYAFRKHVEAGRRNRGLAMIPEFDQFPVFYFSNHHSICGPGNIVCMRDHLEHLDFELEVAVVIGRRGRNIRAEIASDYIAGYMIMNDLSARILQLEEMKLNLGPAKGKDFATATGPWLVTPDELEVYRVPAKSGHRGSTYNLQMRALVNGREVSSGTLADMDWTFGEIIERASYGCDLCPGDIIGSGTVGTGCFLELNGTGAMNNPGYEPQWLKEGDLVELEVTGLGRLSNRIIRTDTDYSILNLKKG